LFCVGFQTTSAALLEQQTCAGCSVLQKVPPTTIGPSPPGSCIQMYMSLHLIASITVVQYVLLLRAPRKLRRCAMKIQTTIDWSQPVSQRLWKMDAPGVRSYTHCSGQICSREQGAATGRKYNVPTTTTTSCLLVLHVVVLVVLLVATCEMCLLDLHAY
jgi:hypothetical protein